VLLIQGGRGYPPRHRSRLGPPNKERSPSPIGIVPILGSWYSKPLAHHCQTDPTHVLETTPKGQGSFGSLASRGRSRRLGNPLNSQSPVSFGQRASRQPSGVQYRRKSIPLNREDQLPLSNCLYPFHRHSHRLWHHRCYDHLKMRRPYDDCCD